MQYQIGYLFDHERFTEEASPLVALTDAGNYGAVYRQAQHVASTIKQGHWILEGNGTFLNQIELIPYGPELTGFCFLVLLSQYLRKVRVPMIMQYVWMGLTALGWTESELKRILHGMYLVTLLKPEWLPNPYEIADNAVMGDTNSPLSYPWFIRPGHAQYAYWRTRQQMEEGWQRLRLVRDEFLRLDFERMRVSRPVKSPHEDVPRGYDQMIRLYARAAQSRYGFLFIRGM
jgi:hypothetical protein